MRAVQAMAVFVLAGCARDSRVRPDGSTASPLVAAPASTISSQAPATSAAPPASTHAAPRVPLPPTPPAAVDFRELASPSVLGHAGWTDSTGTPRLFPLEVDGFSEPVGVITVLDTIAA